MSFQAMAWAIKQKAGGPTRKVILLCLANYADEQGRCFPSQPLIAKEAECSEITVWRSLQALEKASLIKRERRRRKDGTWSSDFISLPIVSPPFKKTNGKANLSSFRSDRSDDTSRQIDEAEPITLEPITRKNESGAGNKEPDRKRMAQKFERLAASIRIPEPTGNRRR